ncbi:MAG: type II toxin-antitoxin system HicA family toxin [Candidatus Liptonbacteria bacterium]|nr:type II toxin-antitoxin system HicA family toxin [Candidatus Liptonbacteria bacterium]
MPSLPRLTAKEISAALENLGFILVRQSGSHKIYKKDGKRVTVPSHSGKILHPKVLKSIMRDAEIDVYQLRELL